MLHCEGGRTVGGGRVAAEHGVAVLQPMVGSASLGRLKVSVAASCGGGCVACSVVQFYSPWWAVHLLEGLRSVRLLAVVVVV